MIGNRRKRNSNASAPAGLSSPLSVLILIHSLAKGILRVARGLRKTATTKTYRRLMAAYSVSGRISTGSRRGARLSLRTAYRSRRLSLSRQAVTERETSPLTPYAIPFHAPIGNSYSDPIFTDLRLLVIHSIEPLNSFCYCRFIFTLFYLRQELLILSPVLMS